MAKLKKSLGLFDGISLLIGITIGSGIFATPQVIAGYLDSFSVIIVLWVGVAIFVYVGSLIYAELGCRFPNTGGEYIYCLLYTSPSPRDRSVSRMPSSA